MGGQTFQSRDQREFLRTDWGPEWKMRTKKDLNKCQKSQRDEWCWLSRKSDSLSGQTVNLRGSKFAHPWSRPLILYFDVTFLILTSVLKRVLFSRHAIRVFHLCVFLKPNDFLGYDKLYSRSKTCVKSHANSNNSVFSFWEIQLVSKRHLGKLKKCGSLGDFPLPNNGHFSESSNPFILCFLLNSLNLSLVKIFCLKASSHPPCKHNPKGCVFMKV